MNESLVTRSKKFVFVLLLLAGILFSLVAQATESLTFSPPQGNMYAGETLAFKVTGDNLRRVTLRIYRLKGTSTAASGSGARTQVLSQVLQSASSRSQMVFKVKVGAPGWYQAEARADESKTAFDEVTFSLAKRPVKGIPVPSLNLDGPSEVNPPGNATFSAAGNLLASATLRAWKLAPGGAQALVYELKKPMSPRPPKKSKNYNSYEPVIRWSAPLKTPGVYLLEATSNRNLKRLKYVRVSDIGIVSKRAPREVLVYAIRLSTGAPIPNAAIRVDDSGVYETRYRKNGAAYQVTIRQPQPSRAAKTGSDGVTRFYKTPVDGTLNISASAPDGSRTYNHSAYVQNSDASDLKVLFYTERPIYRPGQPVFFKGVARRDLSQSGQRGPNNSLFVPVANAKVKLEVTDAANEKFATVEFKTNGTGAFSGQVKLRDDAPVGLYSVETFLRPVGKKTDESFYNRFSVQEYRKPEYEVTLTPQLDAPYAVQGSPVKVLIRARYFFGGAVKGAALEYSGSATETTKLDDNGEALVTLNNPVDPSKQDQTLTLSAKVIDDANRIVESETSILAPYALVRPTISFDKSVYTVQDTAKVTVRTRDPIGRAVSAKTTVRFYYRRVSRVFNRETLRTSEQSEEVEFFKQEVQTDAYGVATFDARLGRAGYLRATVGAVDSNDRLSWSETRFWSLSKVQQPGFYWGDYEFPAIQVLLDKATYQPGETVRALITTNKEKGYVLLALQGDRIFFHRVIKLAGRVNVVEFKFPAAAAPGAHLVAGTSEGRNWSQDTAYVKAVSPAQTLKISLQTDKDEYRPGTTAKYTVSVKDGTGKPQRADVSLGLVDKAIYSLANDETPDPVEFFYGTRENLVSTSWQFPGEVEGGSYQRIEQAVPVRRNFQDTAYWNPFVTTDENGVASLSVALPDNLTTWRATARGITSDTKAGVATDEILVTKPLLTRLILPRFLTQTDRVRAQVIVQNNTAKNQDVRVSLRSGQLTTVAVNGEEEKGAQNKTIPGGSSASFYWMIGTDEVPVGKTASLIATARTGANATTEDSDAQELKLPVQPRGFPVKKWAMGVVREDSKSFTIAQAPGFVRNASTLKIALSPSVAGPMLAALPDLIQYPYGCTEQTLSRFVPAIVAAQAIKTLKLPAPESAKELPKIVEAARSTLYSYQHSDGGWGWWPDDDTDPYLTAYAVYGLSLAKEAGYEIDRDRILKGVVAIQNQFGEEGNTPDGRAYMMQAYATAIKVWNIDPVKELNTKADYPGAVYEFKEKLTNYGLASLALAYQRLAEASIRTLPKNDKSATRLNALLDLLETRARQENGPNGAVASWESGDEDASGWNDSDIEASALAIQVLVRARPQSKLIQPAINWLMQSRRGMQWQSTKDTAQVVIALSQYLKTTDELAPDETVKILVNGETQSTVRFTASDIGQPDKIITLEGFNADAQIEVQRSGKGVTYVSSELVSYGTDTLPTGKNKGFKVTRKYQLQNAKGYWRDISGPIPSGVLVRVDLRVEVDRDFEYVMLEDWLPSGLEVRSEDLGLAGVMEKKCDCETDDLVVVDPPPGWSALPIDRAENRDNRTVHFMDYLGKGRYYLRYIVRPEQPGSRVAPPARIEAMYRPDFNGHSSETTVEVK